MIVGCGGAVRRRIGDRGGRGSRRRERRLSGYRGGAARHVLTSSVELCSPQSCARIAQSVYRAHETQKGPIVDDNDVLIGGQRPDDTTLGLARRTAPWPTNSTSTGTGKLEETLEESRLSEPLLLVVELEITANLAVGHLLGSRATTTIVVETAEGRGSTQRALLMMPAYTLRELTVVGGLE